MELHFVARPRLQEVPYLISSCLTVSAYRAVKHHGGILLKRTKNQASVAFFMDVKALQQAALGESCVKERSISSPRAASGLQSTFRNILGNTDEITRGSRSSVACGDSAWSLFHSVNHFRSFLCFYALDLLICGFAWDLGDLQQGLRPC